MEGIEFEPAHRTAARSYTTQYVSLILIILTFTAGAFARQKLVALQETHTVERRREQVSVARSARLLSEHNFETLLAGDSLNEDQASALAELLKNHDLRAEIEVMSGGDLLTAARNSARLFAYLLGQGVRGSEAEVVALKRGTPDLRVRVRWKRTGKGA